MAVGTTLGRVRAKAVVGARFAIKALKCVGSLHKMIEDELSSTLEALGTRLLIGTPGGIMSSLQFEDRMSRILYTEEAIQRRVRALAAQITADYTADGFAQDSQNRPLLLIGVLRGALMFMTDLARRCPIPVEYDLISVSSYGNGTAPGAVRLVKDLEKPIEGRDVLLIEDIIDTGYTMEYLRRSFAARNPASFRICTLVDKSSRRGVQTTIDYTGFTLTEDEFIVGYGMDYAELYRNLPYIGILKPEYIHE